MIINNNKTEEVYTSGFEDSTKMSLDEDSVSFLMTMISKFYADHIGSPIREVVSNAWDANRAAGTDKPIEVKLQMKNSQWEFSVRDYGVGVDTDLVDNVISKYGKSTKRNDNKALGAFGLNLVS